MIIVGVIIMLLLSIVGWILLATLRFYIDTDENRYYLQLKGLITIQITPSEDLFRMNVWVPFYTFQFDPFKKKERPKKPKKKTKSISSKKKKSLAATFTFVRSLFATFTLKHFRLDLDTGNYPLNGKLVPVFLIMSRGPVTLQTNYMGKSYLSLEIENRLIRLVKPAVKYVFSK